LLEALDARLNEVSKHPEVRVLILRGSQRAFMAGTDINEMQMSAAGAGKVLSQRGQRCMNKLATFEQAVTIAAIEGPMVGSGFELALACDLRIMAEDAKVGFPEVRLGLIPAWGGTQRAAAIIGPARMRRLVFTGQVFSGRIAAENGLVNEAVPAGEVMPLVETIARQILANGPQAVRLAKRVLCMQETSWLEPGWIAEAEAFGEAFSSDEAREGMKAFLEKRVADWSGMGGR
jgi:enoyl-CoA hydratase/carnithine racemase